MFKTAVTGPVVTGGVGVVHACLDCGAEAASGGHGCTGFGPGCLGLQRKFPEVSTNAGDYDVRLTFRNVRSR